MFLHMFIKQLLGSFNIFSLNSTLFQINIAVPYFPEWNFYESPWAISENNSFKFLLDKHKKYFQCTSVIHLPISPLSRATYL